MNVIVSAKSRRVTVPMIGPTLLISYCLAVFEDGLEDQAIHCGLDHALVELGQVHLNIRGTCSPRTAMAFASSRAETRIVPAECGDIHHGD